MCLVHDGSHPDIDQPDSFCARELAWHFKVETGLTKAAVSCQQEMAEAEEAAKRKRRVPRGTSAYQAAWIVDDEGSGDEDADDYEELVEYASDQDQPHAPGTIAESEFGGMTEFADAETDAMEVRQCLWRFTCHDCTLPHRGGGHLQTLLCPMSWLMAI